MIPRPNAKIVSRLLLLMALSAAIGLCYCLYREAQIDAFNRALQLGRPVTSDTQSFEAKFYSALTLARAERYKEATVLFTKLLESASERQKAVIYYNLGNIFFRRGLAINGTNMTVRSEAEYLFFQAKAAYQQALRLDNSDWRPRHNLDRLLTMLPATPTPGVGDSDSPGLIMGNIPVGLP